MSGNAEAQLADLRKADASFSTPPFLEPRKVTWWKNVHFLPGGGKGAAEDVKLALEKFARRLTAAALPENQHFILSGPHLLKTSILSKTLATAAEMVVFAESKWDAEKSATVRAIDFAAEMGLKFAPGVAERFVAIVGRDTRSLMSEVGKMRDYLGPGATVIRAEDVEEITSQGAGVEPEIWAITEAIGERNLDRCLTATRRFEQENGFAVLVTTVVEKFFRQLIDVQAGRTEGMNPYAIRKNSGYLRNWPLRDLRIARWRFMTLRERVVSSSGSADVLVLTELARVIGSPRTRRSAQ